MDTSAFSHGDEAAFVREGREALMQFLELKSNLGVELAKKGKSGDLRKQLAHPREDLASRLKKLAGRYQVQKMALPWLCNEHLLMPQYCARNYWTLYCNSDCENRTLIMKLFGYDVRMPLTGKHKPQATAAAAPRREPKIDLIRVSIYKKRGEDTRGTRHAVIEVRETGLGHWRHTNLPPDGGGTFTWHDGSTEDVGPYRLTQQVEIERFHDLAHPPFSAFKELPRPSGQHGGGTGENSQELCKEFIQQLVSKKHLHANKARDVMNNIRGAIASASDGPLKDRKFGLNVAIELVNVNAEDVQKMDAANFMKDFQINNAA
ncbi:MAG: hypothetical protein Q9159_001771 [Coniocarpon cinnabarinum]